ncbi:MULTISPECIES: dUTP diphosphatase [Rummeliibacillus]|uniref:dUTP diphosphatase n=1 Tax=Rummeliibacillus TaxID=648802 RepID=UPI00123B267F|nr:dUTP diphosphatase [Rummeliibacillus sp. TYF-LIM-RU47]
MNLQELFEMQAELDQHIIENKGLQGVDLIANTYVALQIELSEMANEARWFKHWSNKKDPKDRNSLLEEIADCISFFLSLAIKKNWKDALWIYEEQLDKDEWNGNLTGWYIEMIYFLNSSYITIYNNDENERHEKAYGFYKNQYDFRAAWICFLNIVINGFGFTNEDLEQAYKAKNKVNFERQATGY